MSTEIDDNEGARGPEYPLIGGGRAEKMERRALADGWLSIGVSEDIGKAVINRQAKCAIDPNSSERDARGSAQTLLKAMAITTPVKSEVDVNLHGDVTVSQIVAEVIQDAAATEVIRSRQLGVSDESNDRD